MIEEGANLENQDVYDYLKNMQSEMAQMTNKFADLQDKVTATLEQNAELKIENQHLRDLIKSTHDAETLSDNGKEPQLSKSRKNLEKLYEEGFHVCNYEYGKRRENNEPCAFCVEVIYGER
ncbi:hypothetical protein FC17_GL001557 [Secundilactobacillus paracollinoides DSM 15502 = JCM 11969]|nr:hypothetical protein FC17_GL001557 [Secundilactobacillus paracollinoides DSM 15502 = JCM 11969]